MYLNLFDKFAKMVTEIPDKGVLRAIELECRMVEDDLGHKRTLPLAEANSILSFHRFLKAAAGGAEVPPTTLPMNHWTFYKETVERLVEAGELPSDAQERFAAAFSVALQKP
jgi:hypothetical protein